MRRRIVEHETRSVVLVKQRTAVFRKKFLFLVRAEQFCVFVDVYQIVIARQKPGAARHALDRLVFAQRAVGRIGVDVEFARQLLDVELACEFPRVHEVRIPPWPALPRPVIPERAEARIRNLEIPRCAIAHLRSGSFGPSRNDGPRMLGAMPFFPLPNTPAPFTMTPPS